MARHLVIMAGGIGSRFWPMSTPKFPKQFLDITGCGRTMIQQTVDRYDGIIDINHVWVVTGAAFADIVAEQLQGIDPQHILLEPCMRNTAPCIAYAAWKICKEDPEAVLVVAPSDHLILDTLNFRNAIRSGLDFVAEGSRILTLGMMPDHPETGYGYIEQGDSVSTSKQGVGASGHGAGAIFKLKAFREKPDLETAKSYLAQGGFTWNSGMFLWSVQTIISEIRTHAPQIAGVMDALEPALFTTDEAAALARLFPTCEKISIDYAVMEKTSDAYVMPAEFGWSDLGMWGSLHSLTAKDNNGNAVIGKNVKLIDCQGCMVHVSTEREVVLQGLKDCIVAEHGGTILVCRLDSEQRIKEWHD